MILLFGGTTEGRELTELLLSNGYEVKLSVASDFGFSIGMNSINGKPSVIKGRLDKYAMAKVIREERIKILVDATHPFATAVSLNIDSAAKATGIRCFRFQRDKIEIIDNDLISIVEDIESAIASVKDTKGIVFLAIGSKHVVRFLEAIDDPKNVIVRILPDNESLKRCLDAGVPKKNVIQARGPFSRNENLKDFKRFCPALVVTKNSGRAGGTAEKIEAAQEQNIPIVLIEPPKNRQRTYVTYESLLCGIEEELQLVSKS